MVEVASRIKAFATESLAARVKLSFERVNVEINTYTLPLVLHMQAQLSLSESDGDRLTGEVLVSSEFRALIHNEKSPRPLVFVLCVASVDVDRIAREMDFQSLQQNIMNVTFCNIQSGVKLCVCVCVCVRACVRVCVHVYVC